MYHPEYGAGLVDDDERCDLFLFHGAEGADGEFFGSDRSRGKVHGFGGILVEGGCAFALEESAEVAVADDSNQLAVVDNRGDAEALTGHFVDDFAHWRSGRDLWNGLPAVHQIADSGELAADFAAGVEVGKILGAETLSLGDGDREGVAEGEHGRGRSGGSEVEAAGFLGHAAIEDYVAGLRQGGLHVAAERDERVADSLEGDEEAKDLFGFAAGGERDDYVAGGEAADVAVDGFAGVEKKGGRAGGAEGRGDFLGDNAALAHAGDDDAPAFVAALENEVNGAGEVGGHRAFEAAGERFEGGGFNADELGGGEFWHL